MYPELRIVACASMLAIASILDLKKREVPDKVWLVFGGVGTLLTIFELFLDGNRSNNTNTVDYQNSIAYLIHLSVGLSIAAAIGYITYKVGFFGGADSKALVAIATILPVYNASFKRIAFRCSAFFRMQ